MKFTLATSRMKPMRCPYCNATCDAGTSANAESGKPQPGWISICLYCREFTILDEDYQLRKLAPRELLELQLSPEWPRFDRLRRAAAQINMVAKR
jgi:hypothetical protein